MKKVEINIKFVYNYYYFYNFISKRKLVLNKNILFIRLFLNNFFSFLFSKKKQFFLILILIFCILILSLCYSKRRKNVVPNII